MRAPVDSFATFEAQRAFDDYWRWMIEDELPNAATFLDAGALKAFREHYEALPTASDEGGIRRFLRGAWRTEAGWGCRWIADRVARAPESVIRVLDAGSGFGTHAMLFSALGAVVTGVDLRCDRLDAARRRALFYRFRTGSPARVLYQVADLTRDWGARYHMVWAYDALSQFDPLEDFLLEARRRIHPGGVIVVGDMNGAHPEHLRGPTAPARSLSPEALRALIEASGFQVCHHEMYWGGMSVLPHALHEAVLGPIQRAWWLGSTRARRQLLVATPG